MITAKELYNKYKNCILVSKEDNAYCNKGDSVKVIGYCNTADTPNLIVGISKDKYGWKSLDDEDIVFETADKYWYFSENELSNYFDIKYLSPIKLVNPIDPTKPSIKSIDNESSIEYIEPSIRFSEPIETIKSVEPVGTDKLSGKLHSKLPNDKYTPENITELEPNQIFVFGSNLQGVHLGGAAKLAYEKFGAKIGVGVGLRGQSYAIPTKIFDGNGFDKLITMSIPFIRSYIKSFVETAKLIPSKEFLVTKIGCGAAGLNSMTIGECFKEAEAYDVSNIILPKEFYI